MARREPAHPRVGVPEALAWPALSVSLPSSDRRKRERVTSADPSTGPDAGGTVVTLTGVGFTGAETVLVGGVPADFMVVSDINAAMGLFPQVLINRTVMALEALKKRRADALTSPK